MGRGDLVWKDPGAHQAPLVRAQRGTGPTAALTYILIKQHLRFAGVQNS